MQLLSNPSPSSTTGTGLVPSERAQLPTMLLETLDAAFEFKKRRRAPATVDGYARDWAGFEHWCNGTALASLPATPGCVALYLTHLATSGRRIATLRRHLAAIVVHHRNAGYDLAAALRRSDDFDGVWSGIRRSLPSAPMQKDALEVAALRAIVHALPATPGGVRDRALLLTTFVAAARRSEIAAATWSALRLQPGQGYEFTIAQSKTDQEGKGHTVTLPIGSASGMCPVAALDAWRDLLRAAGHDVGPLTPIFRTVRKGGRIANRAMSPRAVGEVVQRIVLRAGKGAVPGAEALDKHRIDVAREIRAAKAARSAARKAARLERRRLRRRGEHAEADRVVAELPPLPILPASALGGHSLRAGFVTSAVRAGVPLPDIRRQTGHKSAALERYVRRATLWDQNAASRLGL